MINKIPQRYKNASYDDVPGDIKKIFEQIPKTKKGIYIHGGVGTGKTHIAYALLGEWNKRRAEEVDAQEKIKWKYDQEAKRFKTPTNPLDCARARGDVIPEIRPSAEYWGMARLLFEMRSNMRKEGEELIYEDLLKANKLLFLDDIGAERVTEWAEEVFYLVINSYYENEVPVIFTSNDPLSGIAQNVGQRIASRIREMCEIVKLEGEDRRLEK